MIVKDFYKKVEEKGFLKYILYGDTDSLYICIPDRTKKTPEEKLEVLNRVAANINEAIRNFQFNYIFPKLNIDPKHNYTDFKSELLIGSIFFSDIKKSYSCQILAREGQLFEVPEIKYVGGQMVKSDTSDFTKVFLKDLVEGIVLNEKILLKDKYRKAFALYEKFHQDYLRHCENFDLEIIGIPCKWGKKTQIINGMTMYNFIMQTEVFTMGSSGKFVYCRFNNPNVFPFDIKKTNGVVVPFIFDKEELRKRFIHFAIEIDVETQFEKLLTKTGKRILQILEEYKGG